MPDDPQSDAPTEVADVDDVRTGAQAPPLEASRSKSTSKTKSNDGKGGKSGKGLAAAPAKRRAAPEARAVLTSYGIASTVLGLVAVAALVFGLITWNAHHRDVSERTYRSQVLQTAAGWTSLLINLNAENVDQGMQRLHDKTVGELNLEFDAAIQPYREVVQRIQSRSSGRVEAVAIESSKHEFANPDDDQSGQPPPDPGRTDPVMVVATSVAENVGGKPQTVHWTLHLDVSQVDGVPMISRLRSIR